MSWGLYLLAALAEIGGCFAFWAWWRQGAAALWLVPGLAALAGFVILLALTPPDAAGRSYAAYGGVYVACAILWLWLVERQSPSLSDLLGAALVLAGAAVILTGGAVRG